MDREALLSLIDGIYGAGLDASQWPAVLMRISDAFASQEASIGGVAAQAVPWIVAPRTDPEFLESYRSHFHPLNLFWRHMAQLPVGQVATDRMVMSKGDLHGSEFFNDWSRPQGYLSVMGSTLLVEDGWRTEVMIPGKNDYDQEHVDLYQILAPHLARAIQIMQRVNGITSERYGFAEALDRLNQGVLLVDSQSRLVHANRTADTLLAAGQGLTAHGGIVAASAHRATASLQRLIASCGNGDLGDSGGRLSLDRGSGRRPLSLLCIPLRRNGERVFGDRQGAIIFISDPEQETDGRSKALQARFGLTPAEAAFACEIVKGDGRQAAAARRGISESTARTHLSHIFEKTGVHRQAELVRLLMAESAFTPVQKTGPNG